MPLGGRESGRRGAGRAACGRRTEWGRRARGGEGSSACSCPDLDRPRCDLLRIPSVEEGECHNDSHQARGPAVCQVPRQAVTRAITRTGKTRKRRLRIGLGSGGARIQTQACHPFNWRLLGKAWGGSCEVCTGSGAVGGYQDGLGDVGAGYRSQASTWIGRG